MGNSLFGRLFLVISFSLTCCNWVEAALCKDRERRALTKFRNGLHDPLNRLSSWDDLPDCCKWEGITCNKKTGYVIKLDFLNTGNWNLSGELDPSLLELKHLRYLDLSFNSFDGNSIPAFLGSLSELRYLNLSGAGFKGIIPSQLGNLSMLEYLDVSCYEHWNIDLHGLAIDNFQWLGRMISLKYLNMHAVDLSSANEDWLHILNRLPSLVEVHMGNCNLSAIPLTLPVVNITSLRVLVLSSNYFHSNIPKWIASLNNLVSLNLSSNALYGHVPLWFPKLKLLQEIDLEWNYDLHGNLSHILEGFGKKIKRIRLSRNNFDGEILGSIGNMTSLIELRLNHNGITGSIPQRISNLQNLEVLDLSENEIIGSIPESISNLRNLEVLRLSQNGINGGMILDRMCRLKKLKDLSLEECMLLGAIPRCLGELSFLETLDLRSNNLSGVLPETLGQLAHLSKMVIGNNSLSGTVSRVHLKNLTKLKELDMSSNSLALQLHDWSPPFQLDHVILSSCNLGPYFPSWLRLQKDMLLLDISNASISDDMPDWFWDITPQLYILVLSYNKIKGNLPDPFKMKEYGFFRYVDISNNYFSGPLPQGLNHLLCFKASNNHINGTIPSSIGNNSELEVLDLSENFLQGEIPESLGHIYRLTYLHLNKNNLSGGIPNLLKSSLWLWTIDLGENNLSGDIPAWIGDLVALKRLRLQSNLFSGEIPLQLSKASSLQVLDLSKNKLIGSIPPSFGNLSAMRIQNMSYFSESFYFGNSKIRKGYEDKLLVSTKNQKLEYSSILPLVTSLDLSNNDLVGGVPEELTRLVGLRTLDLSGNHFTGKISENINNLNLLESLDLSRNQFIGLIPHSLSYLTSLVYLNLSYNNLSGRIPTGPQLQLLDKSSYMGNAQLCGPPLSECRDDDLTRGDKATSSNEGGGDDMAWFYAGIGPGYAVGFSGILLTLIFKKSWRIVLFQFADGFSS